MKSELRNNAYINDDLVVLMMAQRPSRSQAQDLKNYLSAQNNTPHQPPHS